MKYMMMAVLFCVTACAHKADLKSPSQIEAAQKKKDAKAAKAKTSTPVEQQ